MQTSQKKLEKQLKDEVYEAYAIAKNIYDKNKDTKTKQEITQQIKDALQSIRFNDGRGYYFIYDMKATNIFHPTKPQREGKNYFYDKDVTGTYRNQIAINIVKTKGEGFFHWFFHKPNDTTKEHKKLGFVKKFEPYNWFIGTGEYVEDYENNLKQEILEHLSHVRYKNNEFIGIIDFDGNFLFHPNKKVMHANIFKEKRFNHIAKFYKKLLHSKNIDGYDTHQMKVQGVKIPHETKTLYSKKFDTWGWFISRGFRSSSSSAIIEQKKIALEKKYNQYTKKVFLYTSIIFIILMIITFYLTKKLETKFIKYTSNLDKQIQANKQQKETLLKAQEVAHIGDWQLNINTNKARWSKEILKVFGIKDKNKEFGPDYLKSIMHPDDINCFVNSMENCLKYNVEHYCIYRIYKPDGEIRWIECRGQLDKKTNTVIGTAQDITENKELQIEKEKQDEMILSQSRLAAMGEMISMIAHQWRQPLAAIAMNANNVIVDIELDNFSIEEAKKSANLTLEQTNYLSKTIDDFRNFFKPSHEKNTESIIKVINDSINFMRKMLNQNNITYTLNYDTDEKIMMNSRELIQVFINIIKNAKDALVEHKDIARNINIEVINKEKFTQINICNNGGQIKKENLSKIFEPYFTTKDEHNGTGLGLYMCKLIIENHMQGKLFVENTSYGVCFFIQIPKTLDS